MSYRDDVDALSARHEALATEVAYKTRELEAATRMLDEAKARMRLPILDNIRVASPCPAKWEEMTGDDRVRHCASCTKNVFNLSGMTREEAETLIIAKQGKLCVRYYQRKDGTILTKDCAVGISKKRKRRLFAAGAAAILAASTAAGITVRMLSSNTDTHETDSGHDDDDFRAIAGGISAPPVRELRGEVDIDPATLHAPLTRPGDRHLPDPLHTPKR